MTRWDRTMQVALGAAIALALATAGCESTKNPYDPDKPLDKMTKEEWCAYYAFYLTNPNIGEGTRASATKQMRNRGCPGVA
ncbi:hypothetical protein [Lichenibacterium ramalinae]|nr:hypothetical protein [Lichenibacterium ramalinae]